MDLLRPLLYKSNCKVQALRESHLSTSRFPRRIRSWQTISVRSCIQRSVHKDSAPQAETRKAETQTSDVSTLLTGTRKQTLASANHSQKWVVLHEHVLSVHRFHKFLKSWGKNAKVFYGHPRIPVTSSGMARLGDHQTFPWAPAGFTMTFPSMAHLMSCQVEESKC